MAKTPTPRPTTPEEKVWTVAEAIANGLELAPAGGSIFIDPTSLATVVSGIEVQQIFNKLEKDEEVIEIKYSPLGHELDMIVLRENQGCYEIVVPDMFKFREFVNRAHSRHYGDINMLAGDNFFAVCDVAMDICEELQLTTSQEVFIPVVRDIVRFPTLCPAQSVNMLDRYGDFRMKALAYLKERGHIFAYQLQHEMMASRWEQSIQVVADRYAFDKFYKRMGEAYERRVVEPAKAQKEKVPELSKTPRASAAENPQDIPEKLEVTVKDRQIWVNNFLLSKPHAVGGNKGFFDYLYENADTALSRSEMPEYAKTDVGGKSFSKVLNELGFKGEILKAFCPERGKSQVTFRKSVSTAQLEREGINLPLFLQELRTAHIRNSPK